MKNNITEGDSYLSELTLKLALPCIIYVVIFLFFPILLLIITSLRKRDFNFGTTAELSIEAWYFVITDSNFLLVVMNTLLMSFSTTFICAVLSYLLLFNMMGYEEKKQQLFISLMLLPMGFDILIKVFGWLTFLGFNGWLNQFLIYAGIIQTPVTFLYSVTATYIAQVINFMPVMLLAIWISYIRINHLIIISATDLGAKTWTLFKEIIYPLTKGGLLIGCIFVFTSSLINFIIPEIVGGNHELYIGNFIKYQFFEMRNWSLGSAVSILVYIICIVSAFIFFFIINLSDILKNLSMKRL